MAKRDEKPPSAVEAWNRLLASVDHDDAELGEVPIETVREDIRKAGGNPDAIGARGAALAKALLEKRRLAWQSEARKNIDAAREAVAAVPPVRTASREVLLRKLERVRRDPVIGAQLAASFRKRPAEEATAPELASLLEDIEKLRRLAGLPPDEDNEDDDGGKGNT